MHFKQLGKVVFILLIISLGECLAASPEVGGKMVYSQINWFGSVDSEKQERKILL